MWKLRRLSAVCVLLVLIGAASALQANPDHFPRFARRLQSKLQSAAEAQLQVRDDDNLFLTQLGQPTTGFVMKSVAEQNPDTETSIKVVGAETEGVYTVRLNKKNGYVDQEEEDAVAQKKKAPTAVDVNKYTSQRLALATANGKLSAANSLVANQAQAFKVSDVTTTLFELTKDPNGKACYLPFVSQRATWMEIPDTCKLVFTAGVQGCSVYVGRTGNQEVVDPNRKYYMMHINSNTLRWPFRGTPTGNSKAFTVKEREKWEQYDRKRKERIANVLFDQLKLTQRMLVLDWEDYKYSHDDNNFRHTIPVCVKMPYFPNSPGEKWHCRAVQTTAATGGGSGSTLTLHPFKMWAPP